MGLGTRFLNMTRHRTRRWYPWLAVPVLATTLDAQTDGPAAMAELFELPVGEWLSDGAVEELRWDLDVDNAELRMDQRLVLPLTARVRTEDLETVNIERDLTVWSWLTDPEERLLAYSGPVRYTSGGGPSRDGEIVFTLEPVVTPGDYRLWVLLYDAVSGRHNLAREDIEVDTIDDDPFPESFAQVPAAAFPEEDALVGDLTFPIESARALEIELIAVLSMPEHRSSDTARTRHIDNVGDALRFLSQLDPARGTVSVRGLDLVRREVVFEQPNLERLDLGGLADAFESANAQSISLEALAGRLENPVFFREYVEGHVVNRVAEGIEVARRDAPLKVLIFVSGFSRFADGADRSELEIDGRCDCRVYHVRIRQSIRDLFDEVNGILDPLSPRTLNVLSPKELRNAIGQIVEDLERF